MFSKTFDITESTEAVIECPYCRQKIRYDVADADSNLINCPANMAVCGLLFVISIQTLETKDVKKEAWVQCRKIEGFSGAVIEIREGSRNNLALQS